MDPYQALRELTLTSVLAALGVTTEWKSRKGGTEWSGPCPLCKPKKNRGNFSFAADGKYRCFSCPAKGRGAIDLTMALKGVGFQEAVSVLSSLASSPPGTGPRPTARLPQATIQTAESAPSGPSENPPFKGQYHKYYVPSEWLAKRGISPHTLERFGVGEYSNPARQSIYKGKILLHVRRWKDSELVAYLARESDPAAENKYIWPKGFPKHLELFGAVQIREDHALPLRTCFLLESPFAVMAFWQKGFPAVSPFGWSVSAEQVAILKDLAKGVVFLPDKDKTKEAAQYAGLMAKSVWVKMPEYQADDPEKLSKAEIQKLA